MEHLLVIGEPPSRDSRGALVDALLMMSPFRSVHGLRFFTSLSVFAVNPFLRMLRLEAEGTEDTEES